MANTTQIGRGSVVSLWRYPVKSMMGEELNAAEVDDRGLLGDRAYALVDRSNGKIASAKNPRKWPHLFDFRAAFVDTPRSSTEVLPIRITLPDGTIVTSTQTDVDQILSQALNREVRLDATERRDQEVVDSKVPHPQAPKLAPDNHDLIWLPGNAFAAAFAQHASTEEQAVLAAVQRPIAVACIGVKVGRPLWKDRPTWFLVAEQDRMICPDTQRFMAGRMEAKVRSHQVDHAPGVTAPGVVVDIIREAMRAITNSGESQ